MNRSLHRLGERCAARPLLVIGIWLVVAGAVTGLSLAVGGHYTKHERLPGTEVERGIDVLSRSFPAAAAESAEVVVRAPTASALGGVVAAVTARVSALPHVAAVSSGAADLAADGTARRLRITYDGDRFGLPADSLARLRTALASAVRAA